MCRFNNRLIFIGGLPDGKLAFMISIDQGLEMIIASPLSNLAYGAAHLLFKQIFAIGCVEIWENNDLKPAPL